MQSRNNLKYELDNSDKALIDYKVRTKTVEVYIEECLKEIDITNNKYLQTIHFRYKWLIAVLLYLGCDRETIGKIHKANVEYEETNPPIVYSKGVSKKTVTKTKVKSKAKVKSKGELVDTSPVKECLPNNVRLVKLENNQSLIVSRETAINLITQFNGKYKIEEL